MATKSLVFSKYSPDVVQFTENAELCFDVNPFFCKPANKIVTGMSSLKTCILKF